MILKQEAAGSKHEKATLFLGRVRGGGETSARRAPRKKPMMETMCI